jgi:SAM-dependent methyltransferase
MSGVARYDGLAEWYDENLRRFTLRWTDALRELLGPGPGRCLDLGCGTGLHFPTLVALGWKTTGIDLSADQLRLAAARDDGVEVVQADASSLPFEDDSFDAVVSIFTHTDMDDYPGAVREATRVLVPGSRYLHLGLHPCFVGPFARQVEEDEVPVLFPGYRSSGWTDDGPGFGQGLRRRVGMRHLPLAELLQCFAGAGLALERFEEPGEGVYPHVFAVACRKP